VVSFKAQSLYCRGKSPQYLLDGRLVNTKTGMMKYSDQQAKGPQTIMKNHEIF
jgi:hypothetical protein